MWLTKSQNNPVSWQKKLFDKFFSTSKLISFLCDVFIVNLGESLNFVRSNLISLFAFLKDSDLNLQKKHVLNDLYNEVPR